MKEDRNTIMYSYGKMVQRAEQRHEAYVRSNYKSYQLGSAVDMLKDKIGKFGDVGMGTVVKILDDLFQEEKKRNARLQDDYYESIKFIEEFERYVEEASGEKIGNINDHLDKHSQELVKILRGEEEQARAKYCQ